MVFSLQPKCSARSECSTSLSFSSPTPTRRSLQRRVTLSQTPSIRSESCSPFRNPTTAIPSIKLMSDERNVGGRTRGSPATSISSGLGRSFSPASAHSSYLRPLGILRKFLNCLPDVCVWLKINSYQLFCCRQSKSAIANAKHRFAVFVVGWAKCERHLPLPCAQSTF